MDEGEIWVGVDRIDALNDHCAFPRLDKIVQSLCNLILVQLYISDIFSNDFTLALDNVRTAPGVIDWEEYALFGRPFVFLCVKFVEFVA